MNLTPSATPLRDVLYEFSLAKCVPDAQLLDDFVRRFPQYADSLTEFAIELAMDALQPEPEVAAKATIDLNHVSPAVSRAMSRFQNRLQAVRQVPTPISDQALSPRVEDVPNPFAELSRSKIRALAHRIGANNVFVIKLRDRQIKPDTIPGGFLQFLANVLETSLDFVTAHFDAPPSASTMVPQFYKADDKPDGNQQQSFVEAVKSSGLDEDQQHQLLNF